MLFLELACGKQSQNECRFSQEKRKKKNEDSMKCLEQVFGKHFDAQFCMR